MGSGNGSSSSITNYIQNLWDITPDDGKVYQYTPGDPGNSITKYYYSNGTYEFETPHYHGVESKTDGDLYSYEGAIVKAGTAPIFDNISNPTNYTLSVLDLV
jgi:hypothetical protein